MNEIVIARIRHCLKKLEDPRTKQTERLMCWRLIRSSADDAHESEARHIDELAREESKRQVIEAINSIKADPALEVPIA